METSASRSPVGRHVKLFLVEGTAAGLVAAELVNWTGHVLAGPRDSLATMRRREEAKRTGVYILTGDLKQTGIQRIYIGESDNVAKRLDHHLSSSKSSNKAFWERTWVITSKDRNITKAHARYLEAELVRVVESDSAWELDNDNSPRPVALPEADASDMAFFIDQLQTVLPLLGLDLLRQREATLEIASAHSPLFRLASTSQDKTQDVGALARPIVGGFVVLKNSGVMPNRTDGIDYSYKGQRELLIEAGKIDSSRWTFVEDVPFSSPSAAASVVLDRNANGRSAWKIEDSGLTYGEWLEQASDTVGENPSARDNPTNG